jgi:hypothetical protein
VCVCVETGSSAVGSELSITLMCLFHYQHFDSQITANPNLKIIW